MSPYKQKLSRLGTFMAELQVQDKIAKEQVNIGNRRFGATFASKKAS